MEKEATISALIRDIYEQHAHGVYFGEEITQLEHAIQSYQLAKGKNADLELCIGAFLHDIGHLISEDHEELGGISHETEGSVWLEKHGFPPRILAVVSEHVNAKRYLCYKYPSYYNKLSEASKATLILQGGAMKKKEAEMFEMNPFFDDIILVRVWDEQAKETAIEHINPEDIYIQIDQLFLQNEREVTSSSTSS